MRTVNRLLASLLLAALLASGCAPEPAPAPPSPLHSDDPAERRHAIEALGEKFGPPVRPPTGGQP